MFALNPHMEFYVGIIHLKQYYSNTMLNLNTDEVDEELVLSMFNEGKCEYAIHKETKIGRHRIKRILSNL